MHSNNKNPPPPKQGIVVYACHAFHLDGSFDTVPGTWTPQTETRLCISSQGTISLILLRPSGCDSGPDQDPLA